MPLVLFPLPASARRALVPPLPAHGPPVFAKQKGLRVVSSFRFLFLLSFLRERAGFFERKKRVPTFFSSITSKTNKNSNKNKLRELVLLSSDLSRGWRAEFTLEDLRESREVGEGAIQREVLEPEAKLLSFLADAGEEGALARAEAAVVAGAVGGSAGGGISLTLRHGGPPPARSRVYSLPPHLASAPWDSPAPRALPFRDDGDDGEGHGGDRDGGGLRRATAELVEALWSRAEAAEARAGAAERAVEAGRRLVGAAATLVANKVEGPVKLSKPSEEEVRAARDAVGGGPSSARGGGRGNGGGGGGGAAAVAAAACPKAQAVLAADKRLRRALSAAAEVRGALQEASRDPSRSFSTGKYDLFGGGVNGGGGGGGAGPSASLSSLPGSAAASPAAAAAASRRPSPTQPQQQQLQLSLSLAPPPHFSLSLPAAAAAALQQSQQQLKQEPGLLSQPPRPSIPTKKPVPSSSARFVPPSGAGKVKKRRK